MSAKRVGGLVAVPLIKNELKTSESGSTTMDIADYFYSLPPKSRTKKRLRQMLLEHANDYNEFDRRQKLIAAIDRKLAFAVHPDHLKPAYKLLDKLKAELGGTT